jgi:homoserine O-acetyltransferase/O-succinyltransferase
MQGPIRIVMLAAALALPCAALADVGVVEKKVFALPSLTTQGGKTIKNVRVGYESYGRLNATGDNAIFIAHFFSGTSNAAGRYKADGKPTGYWHGIIGPGLPIDTNRYFVVSADTLVNLNVKDPNVTTTGPATINPDTGKPYGSTFPVVTYRDSVVVHKALLDSLGVKKLVAAIGASGGSMQAMEWGAAYPEFVERVVHVIGPGLDIHPYAIGLLDMWMTPIKLDPRWAGGDYYGKDEPRDGLGHALKFVTLTALHYGWAERVHGYKWAAADKNPVDAMGNLFAIEDTLTRTGLARAAATDANHFIWMTKANQLYNLDKEASRIKAKVLFIPASSDLIFPPALSRKAAERLRAQGNVVEVFELQGSGGHLDGVFQIGQAGDTLRAFLTK